MLWDMLAKFPLKLELVEASNVPFIRHEGDPTNYESWLGVNLDFDLLEPTRLALEEKYGELATRGEAVCVSFHLNSLSGSTSQ